MNKVDSIPFFKKCGEFSVFLILLVFGHFYHCALQNEQGLSESQPGEIYISPGTVVYNISAVTNAKVTHIHQPPKKTVTVKKKPVSRTVADQVIDNQVTKNKRAEKIQKRVDLYTQFINFSLPSDTDVKGMGREKIKAALTTAYTFSFKAIGSSVLVSTPGIMLIAQLEKQKFYTSFSFLQFSKLRNSFLRGPPSHLFLS